MSETRLALMRRQAHEGMRMSWSSRSGGDDIVTALALCVRASRDIPVDAFDVMIPGPKYFTDAFGIERWGVPGTWYR